MFQKKYIVYRKDVCLINDIFEMKEIKYYNLAPLSDQSLAIKVPVDNPFLRDILTKEEAIDLIKTIESIEPLDINEKLIENEYQHLLVSSSLLDLIKIIKTSYLRNEKRKNNGKKISEKDEFYFNKAEKLLYTELALSLDLPYEETKDYVINQILNQKK